MDTHTHTRLTRLPYMYPIAGTDPTGECRSFIFYNPYHRERESIEREGEWPHNAAGGHKRLTDQTITPYMGSVGPPHILIGNTNHFQASSFHGRLWSEE